MNKPKKDAANQKAIELAGQFQVIVFRAMGNQAVTMPELSRRTKIPLRRLAKLLVTDSIKTTTDDVTNIGFSLGIHFGFRKDHDGGIFITVQ